MGYTVNSNPKQEIKVFQTTEQLAEFIGSIWQNGTKNLKLNSFYSIALSGGSTPIKIFQYLAENFQNRIEWTKIKFYWGDERCVPPEDDDSNYRIAKENLFNIVKLKSDNIYRIHGESDPPKEATRYTNILRKELTSSNGLPKFNFILLGMGEDGHTASIFPNQIELFHSQIYCEVAQHPISHQKRITLTGSIINNADTITIAAVGKSKAEKVADAITKRDQANQYPVSLVNPSHGTLIWLLDRESASLIKKEKL